MAGLQCTEKRSKAELQEPKDTTRNNLDENIKIIFTFFIIEGLNLRLHMINLQLHNVRGSPKSNKLLTTTVSIEKICFLHIFFDLQLLLFEK